MLSDGFTGIFVPNPDRKRLVSRWLTSKCNWSYPRTLLLRNIAWFLFPKSILPIKTAADNYENRANPKGNDSDRFVLESMQPGEREYQAA